MCCIKINLTYFFDEAGIECSEEEAYGFPSCHRLVHKSYALFFDEVGVNLRGDKNGKVGGQRFVKAAGAEKANSIVNANDVRHTTLGFTAATGQPVLCVVVTQAT